MNQSESKAPTGTATPHQPGSAIHVGATKPLAKSGVVPDPRRRHLALPTTTMSTPTAGDDPRDASAETKMSFPETWKTDNLGA